MVTVTYCMPGGSDTIWDANNVNTGLFGGNGNTILFRPGKYELKKKITVGPNTTVKGTNVITMPADQSQVPIADPSKMAVFFAGPYTSPSSNKVNNYTGGFRIDFNTSGVILSDFFCLGYIGIDYYAATNCKTINVAIDNKPGSKWCWFQQTGAFFMYAGSSNNEFTGCFARAQHHGFMNQGSYGGWIKNIRYSNCRAIDCGCGLEPDGSGRGDWSVCFDLAEQVDVDGIYVDYCYASKGGKVGFYTEPTATGCCERGNNHENCQGDPYIRRNIVLTNCYAEDNGKYGGGFRGQMLCKEGEQANYYGGGWKLVNCISARGSKAGFYARVEFDTNPIYENCVDVGSNIGFLLELAAAGAIYNNCISYEPVKKGWQVMGGGPIIINNAKVQVKNGAIGFYFGGYFRIYAADSWDSSNQSATRESIGQSYWSAGKLSVTAQVSGSPAAQAACGSNTSNVKITSIAEFPVPPVIRTYTNPDTPDVPDPVIPDPVDTHVCEQEECQNGKRVKWDCTTKAYVFVPEKDYLCSSKYCDTAGSTDCKNGILYECDGTTHQWVSKNRPCKNEETLPVDVAYVLNNVSPTRINAKDYNKGGPGVGYSDTTANDEGKKNTRSDNGVDVVTWERGTDTGSSVVAYTANTEWVAYTVGVKNKGVYRIKYRVSTPNTGCKIKAYVNGTLAGDYDIQNTGDFGTFITTEEVNLPVFNKTTSVIKLEFIGDMNLNWFELTYVSGLTGDDPDGDNQTPYTQTSINFEFEGKIKVNSVWYDIGGEGVGYHKEEPETTKNDRGDPIETVSAKNNQISAIIGSTDDWLMYTLNVIDSESYNIDIMASSTDSTSSLKLVHGGIELCKPIEIGNTGGVFKRFTIKNISLYAAPDYDLKIVFHGIVSFSSMEFYGIERDINVSYPYQGEGHPFKLPVYKNDEPLTIEAEFFNRGALGAAYADDTIQNLSGEITRDTSVDLYTSKDYLTTSIDWTSQAEWLEYTVNVKHILAEPPVVPEPQGSERIISISEYGSDIGYVGYGFQNISEVDYEVDPHAENTEYVPYILLGANNQASLFKYIDNSGDWYIADYTDPENTLVFGDDESEHGDYVSSFRDTGGNILKLYEKGIYDKDGNFTTFSVDIPTGTSIYSACCLGNSYLVCTGKGVYTFGGVKVSNLAVTQIEFLHGNTIIGLTDNRIFRSDYGGLKSELLAITSGMIQSIYYNRTTNTIAALVNDNGNVYVYYSRSDGVKGSWSVVTISATGEGTAFCVADDNKVYVGMEYGILGSKTWELKVEILKELPVLYIASSDGTAPLLYSLNGTVWNKVTSPLMTIASGIGYNGSMWIVTGDGTYPVISSTDGKTWTGHAIAGMGITYDVLWTGDTWIVIGTGKVAYSKDGINWTATTSVTGFGIETDGTTTIVVGGVVSKSTDNAVWTTIAGLSGNAVAHNGDSRWVIGGMNSNGIYYSDDTITWYNVATDIFTACYDVAYNGHQWLAVGEGNYKLAYSDDGEHWTGVDVSFTIGYGVAWNGGMWIATGSGSIKMMCSVDGIEWIDVVSSSFEGVIVNQIACKNMPYKNEYWNTHILPNIVVVGNGLYDTIVGSYSGSTWTGYGKTMFTYGYDVLWNGSKYFAVGEGPNSLATSVNGITWEGKGKSVIESGYGISWNGSKLIVVGQGSVNTIMKSENGGSTWTGLGKTIFDTSGSGVTWDGTVFVAVGIGSVNTIATSSDGTTWTGRGITYLSAGFCVATNGTKLIAGGTGTNQMVVSINNGVTWTARGTGIFTSVNGIANNGTMWIAVGHGNNSIAWSLDGDSWNGLGNDIFDSGLSVAWNGGMWIATGAGYRNSIATSINGVDWTGLGNVTIDIADGICCKNEPYRGKYWNTPPAAAMHDVVITQSTGGTITPSGTVSIQHGDSLTFALLPNSGYVSTGISVDGGSLITNYVISNITTGHNVTPTFTRTTYAFTLSVSGGYGSITTNVVNQSVNAGDTPTITFTPDSGYMISNITINGVTVPLSANTNYYTLSPVYTITTVVVTFTIIVDRHTITVTQPIHGTISPPGQISIMHGNSQTFTFSPAIGCELYSYTLDGNYTVTSNLSLPITNVTADHTLTATFDQNTYQVYFNSFTHGTVTKSGTSISSGGTEVVMGGDSATYTFTPDSGYRIQSVTVGGSAVTLTNNTYTLNSVAANVSIVVTYAVIQTTFTITLQQLAGGVITSTATTVSTGDSVVITATPNTGYEPFNHYLGIDQNIVTLDGNNQYTLSNINADHTITGMFSLIQYNFNISSSGTGGSITCNIPNGTVNYGTSFTLTHTYQTGYEIKTCYINGGTVNFAWFFAEEPSGYSSIDTIDEYSVKTLVAVFGPV